MMFRLRRLVPLLAIVAALVTAAVACGDDDGPSATTPPPTGAASPTGMPESPAATSAPATPTEEPFSGGREPVVVTPGPGIQTVLLQEIRIAEHSAFDRITFQFQDGVPGYDVRYVEPPIVYDPRGDEMEIEGSAFIVVRMERAAGHDPNTGEETYTGPLELKPGLPAILEAERVGDFEGILSWALGLAAEADFRVTALEDRLVVDVAHP